MKQQVTQKEIAGKIEKTISEARSAIKKIKKTDVAYFQEVESAILRFSICNNVNPNTIYLIMFGKKREISNCSGNQLSFQWDE